ncbi:P-loop containing nucleoside triphosphate hydrolase [Pseudocohnilembus persalinus]|uniref:p-loop containing nucleoside triphosphate hydrolase n=1 Tax=Pseudocohnilembus persalinus TaxID=266149 RepID=A0A0V0QVQ2_PSEPJ|nr:P-loop containing nucleoside triphosphate hydrolase [Pseudocohnilembus persalinus]|eukprot:KRX06343.1 P-loop containing nucleoside triphosphate hydrolase [Pseudocohnilembus persalinus]
MTIQFLTQQIAIKSLIFKSLLQRDTLQPFSQDIIEYANRAPLQILVHGKPKTGKTSFCKELAKMIDIVHIEPLILIEKAINKIKDFEENPPETDEDGNPKETLPDAISKVKENLDAGKEVPAESL